MFVYPKGERPWVAYYTQDHTIRYLITSKTTSQDAYYLYEVTGEMLKKLGKGKTPRELEEKFRVEEKVRDSP